MDQIVEASSKAAVEWNPYHPDSFTTLQIRNLRAMHPPILNMPERRVGAADMGQRGRAEDHPKREVTPMATTESSEDLATRMGAQAREALLKRVENDFSYHAPKEGQTASYTEIRAEARSLAETMVSRCPSTRELSSALAHLESSVMFANAAIARHG